MSESSSTSTNEQNISPESAEVLSTIETLRLSPDVVLRAEQLSDINAESILQAATMLHTGLAPRESHEPSDIARTVRNLKDETVSAVLLQPRERMPLFEHAAGLIRELYTKQQPGSEQAFLDRTGNILALSLLLAHTFEDGNGRVARTLAHSVRNGSEITPDNQADFLTVATNRPSQGFKIDSYVPIGAGKDLTPDELLVAAASLEIPLSDQAGYQQKVHENFSTPYN